MLLVYTFARKVRLVVFVPLNTSFDGKILRGEMTCCWWSDLYLTTFHSYDFHRPTALLLN